MFVKNCWYMGAWASEVTAKPLGRTLLGEPVMFYRQGNGKVAALKDECCHRGLPLTQGEVVGDNFRCGYHGLEFDCSGMCVKVPGQDTVPPNARVRSYVVEEKYGIVWIWMGDPAKADPAEIVAYPWHDDPAWVWKTGYYHVKANYELIHDNLLDLTHVGLVHRNTIGGSPDTHSNAEMKTTREGNHVNVIRWMLDSVPPPTYKAAWEFKGNVDRWQEIDFDLGVVRIFSGAKDVGTGAYQGNRDGGFGQRNLNCVTPETESTTHYFWSTARNFRIAEPAVTEVMYKSFADTFMEDVVILEIQADRLQGRSPRSGGVDIKTDLGSIHVRRVIESRLKLEQADGQS